MKAEIELSFQDTTVQWPQSLPINIHVQMAHTTTSQVRRIPVYVRSVLLGNTALLQGCLCLLESVLEAGTVHLALGPANQQCWVTTLVQHVTAQLRVLAGNARRVLSVQKDRLLRFRVLEDITVMWQV